MILHTFRYQAFMPMGRDRKIVHLKASVQYAYARFVCFEQLIAGTSISCEMTSHGARYFITMRSLDEESIKVLLAKINSCAPEQIEIDLHADAMVGSRDDSLPRRGELGSSQPRKRNKRVHRFDESSPSQRGWASH